MYSIKVEGAFSSAHNLRGYHGRCEDLHGHNWRVEALIKGARLNPAGMIADFKDVKARLNAILDTLDHKYLNDIKPFKTANPTSENIARHIYCLLKKEYPGLASVTVWENSTSAATYEE